MSNGAVSAVESLRVSKLHHDGVVRGQCQLEQLQRLQPELSRSRVETDRAVSEGHERHLQPVRGVPRGGREWETSWQRDVGERMGQHDAGPHNQASAGGVRVRLRVWLLQGQLRGCSVQAVQHKSSVWGRLEAHGVHSVGRQSLRGAVRGRVKTNDLFALGARQRMPLELRPRQEPVGDRLRDVFLARMRVKKTRPC